MICDHCQKPFVQARNGQRFCGSSCRSAWHRGNAFPGKVTGLRALKNGIWAVTVHYTQQPTGIRIGTSVLLETTSIPRPDASTDEKAA
jgi:hypothetical protein